MRRLALIAALGLALAGCSDSTRIIKAKTAVAERFAYPGATEFRELREVARGVCGQANGRRVNGQMSGFRRFYR
jgi:hypothetical protein